MRRILLDTSAFSAFMRNQQDAVFCVRGAAEIYLTPIVLGELHSGFQRGSRSEENAQLLSEFLASPRVTILVIDEETAFRYAEIINALRRTGTPIPTNDIWIAASAVQHGLYVITADHHFTKVCQVTTKLLSET